MPPIAWVDARGAGDQLSIGEWDVRRLDVLAELARVLRVTLGDLLGEPVLREDDEAHDDVPAVRHALMAPRRLSRTFFSSSMRLEYIPSNVEMHRVSAALDWGDNPQVIEVRPAD